MFPLQQKSVLPLGKSIIQKGNCDVAHWRLEALVYGPDLLRICVEVVWCWVTPATGAQGTPMTIVRVMERSQIEFSASS